MSKPQRCERVYQAVAACTARFSLPEPRKTIRHLQVSAIAEQAGVSPNNTSTELCRLFRQGRLVRVDSRPRLYCDLQLLERRLRRTLPAVEYGSLEQFLTELRGEAASVPPQRSGAAPEGGLHAGAASEFDGLIGCGQSLRDAIATAKAAMLYPPFGMHTLLTGETGVGKSNFAACMYDYGRRCGKLAPDARFVTFNCANYSDNPQLLMSQLFGHCRGAFTGADHDRPGLVEHADGGILFLDEIHRLHPEGQEKLFHLIDKGTFRRMGETADDRHVRILIVGATTESPQACMLSTFLRRISVHLVLPPLRERSVQERLTLVLYFISGGRPRSSSGGSSWTGIS